MSYIREYSDLGPKERRQLSFKRRYKAEHPDWDDSMVRLVELVRERVKPGSSVLDFGCGRGNFVLDELADKFGEKVGLDVALESTTDNVSVDRVIISSDETWPLADSSFDAAVSLWVFEHVENPAAVFGEVARVLKPGGFFAFVTPNRSSFLIWLRRLMNDGLSTWLVKSLYGRVEDDQFSVYYRANTIADVTKTAMAAGLSVEYIATNQDPSYTSFGSFSYFISALLAALPGQLFRPHLIAILRKS